LAALGIQTGPFACEHDPVSGRVLTMRIPVLANPTASTCPPEVNVARSRGYVVLRDVLGYQQVNGRYEFAAEDLLQRVDSVTEDKIAAATASPVAGPEGVRRTPSPVSMKATRRCLDEIKRFALWAAQHNYRALAAA
jgi:hypothetical protein